MTSLRHRRAAFRSIAIMALVLLLAVGARGQVLETLVSLQNAAAGSFPSGKLLLASDGNFYGSTETMTQP